MVIYFLEVFNFEVIIFLSRLMKFIAMCHYTVTAVLTSAATKIEWILHFILDLEIKSYDALNCN